uniref:Ion transport domain-containing protein n=1 Tax=Amphimedon queenslandica TaxID=400682 RepID=A0A1X7SL65_AMPQE
MLKKALKAIFKVSWRQLFVLALYALLFIVIFIFMIIGFGMFSQDHDEYEYLNSSADAYWNLIVYLSTANSPDIATPAYEHHRLYYLYFCIFYFIGYVLILKVIAAFYAINFLSFLEESMKRTWNHQQHSLDLAFNRMKNNENKIDSIELIKILTSLNIHWDGVKIEDKLENDDFKEKIREVFYKRQETKEYLPIDSAKARPIIKCLSFLTNLLSFLLGVCQFSALTVLVIKDHNDNIEDYDSTMAKTMMGFSVALGIEIITKLVLAVMNLAIYCNRESSNKKESSNEDESSNKKESSNEDE